MVIGKSTEQGHLSEEDIFDLCSKAFSTIEVHNRRILVIIPDHTRNAPVGLFFRLMYQLIGEKVRKLDYLVALGTHPPLKEAEILRRVDITKKEWQGKYAKVNFFNHQWDDPASLKVIGTIPEAEIDEISKGMLKEEIRITLNSIIYNYDFLILLSPVVPHEVAGFSGGNKYFFPGIAGENIIHCFHWLAALITNPVINGTKENPVRRLLDRAASFIDIPTMGLCMVVHDKKLSGLFIGDVEEAWSEAADLSATLHIRYVDTPFHSVLGVAPSYYDDIWVAGKVMYKLEPVVADGGELIIYAPHITEISYTHGEILRHIGYHVGDYYLKQIDQFTDIPRCVLAHSTHVRGVGTFENGVEKPRITVTLATGIPAQMCDLVNLGCRDASSIDFSEWKGREDEGILFVEDAGEILYRLKSNNK